MALMLATDVAYGFGSFQSKSKFIIMHVSSVAFFEVCCLDMQLQCQGRTMFLQFR